MAAGKTVRRAVLAATFALLFCVCVLGVPKRLGEPFPYLLEMALYVLGALLALDATRRALERRGSALRPLWVAAGIAALLATGQAIRVRKAYPLMAYTMYGRAREGAATFYEYRARHQSGREAQFRPSSVVATLGKGRIVRGLAERIESTREGDRRLAESALQALIGLYNARHAADPIVAVDVLRVVLPPPFRPSAAEKSPVLRVAAEPAP